MTVLNIKKLSFYVMLLSVAFAQVLVVSAAENSLNSDDVDSVIPSIEIAWRVSDSESGGGPTIDVRDTIETHKKEGTTDSPGYDLIVGVFYEKQVCKTCRPKVMETSFVVMMQHPTVYHAMFGPLEFDFTGTLKSCSYLDQIHTIATPLTNGVMDEAQDVCVSHFFQRILHVRSNTQEWNDQITITISSFYGTTKDKFKGSSASMGYVAVSWTKVPPVRVYV
ncbi:hypothetical protein C8R48DRAFT_762409 [Suillus tomentosus]|nr:hypothetical protein C8R48DRAFT_762409 [Suillus tomentosus]